VSTGIYEEPVEGRLPLQLFNLRGDEQADLTVHGGREKAVYVHPSEHYPFWRKEYPDLLFQPGWFGENFTTKGWMNGWCASAINSGSAVPWSW